jgi:hypothetical protein
MKCDGHWLNKEQTDLLGWTDETDANDVIIVDGQGNIVKRRPMMMVSMVNGEFESNHSFYKLNDKGEWIWTEEPSSKQQA